MTSLKQLFEKQQVGFTVYSPDCTQSRLWGNLDHAIHDATGFRVVERHWINHDVNSIARFYSGEEPPPEQDPVEGAKKYDSIPVEDVKYGHLVVKLFLSGPALLTFWQGDNVVETLLALKGATHPPEAGAETIRGRFWCDNGVCNLIHASDDYAEAERELKSVNLLHLLDREAVSLPLIEPIAAPEHYVAHSGISVVCDLVYRMTLDRVEKKAAKLPPSGDAKETNRALTAYLREANATFPNLALFIDAYLKGDLVTVTGMLKEMPVTRWEQFVVQCGAITRYKWNEQ